MLKKNDAVTLSDYGKTQIRRERGSHYGMIVMRPRGPISECPCCAAIAAGK